MKIIIISGLPASGKSTLGHHLTDDVKHAFLLDDLSVILRTKSLKLENIHELLPKHTETLVITDVLTCVDKNQYALYKSLMEQFPDCKINWIFFLPNLQASIENHQRRRNTGVERHVIPSIHNMAKLFSIHPDIKSMSVEYRQTYQHTIQKTLKN